MPTSSEYGTYKTVTAGFWPWLEGESPYNLLRCSLFARKLSIGRIGTVFGDVFSSSLLLASLELSDTTIYEPHIRALLGEVGPSDSSTFRSEEGPVSGWILEQDQIVFFNCLDL